MMLSDHLRPVVSHRLQEEIVGFQNIAFEIELDNGCQRRIDEASATDWVFLTPNKGMGSSSFAIVPQRN